jgi:2',3'-cyclic-nucleotide 3'-phosphodiesterase
LTPFIVANGSKQGLGIWLVPPPAATAALRQLMRVRPHFPSESALPNKPGSGTFHGSGSYPSFDPHITLADAIPSTVPLQTILSAITSALTDPSPLDAKFSRLERGDHYFRSVYLVVHPSPSLVAVHKHIHDALGCAPATPKFPHLSLAYITDADDADRGHRAALRDALLDVGLVIESESAVKVKAAEGDEYFDGFQGGEIWVIDCSGPVETWKDKVLEKVVLPR